MTVDRERGRFDIQLFGDVFPDLDQSLATLTTSTGFQVMAMVDARQMVREWLTPRPGSSLLGLFRFGIGTEGVDLFSEVAHILGQPLMEEILQLSLESFAFLPKANAAEISQFEFQLLDEEAVMLDALFEAIIIRLNTGDQGPPNGRINLQCFQQGQGFHGHELYRMAAFISMI